MNDKQFDELKAAVKVMARHMRGEKVPGLRVYEAPPSAKPSSRG
jgi:hypothetical protein